MEGGAARTVQGRRSVYIYIYMYLYTLMHLHEYVYIYTWGLCSEPACFPTVGVELFVFLGTSKFGTNNGSIPPTLDSHHMLGHHIANRNERRTKRRARKQREQGQEKEQKRREERKKGHNRKKNQTRRAKRKKRKERTDLRSLKKARPQPGPEK